VIEAPRTISKNVVWTLLACLVVYTIVRSTVAAAGKLFWYDELLTLTVSSLGSWNERLSALKLPLDGQPPLFYAMEHFALRLMRNQEIALRLPSILAFPCVLVCIFVYVRKRGGEVLALVCAALLLMTEAFDPYAVEARPYSMLLTCIAFALVCYQRVPARLWTLLLAASLALAESLHYMAVVSMVPFGLAEVVTLWKTKRIRWPVWVALSVGVVPLLLQWKLLAANRSFYGPHFWAHFSFHDLPKAYADFFAAHSPIGGGIAALCVVAIVGAYLWPTGDVAEEQPSSSAADTVLLLSLVLLPLIAYLLVTVALRSGLTPRYVLATVLGIALAAGFALSRSLRAIVLFAAFVFAALSVQELSFWRSAKTRIADKNCNAREIQAFVNNAGYPDLPVVIPHPMFLPLAHYLSPPLLNRLVFMQPRPLEDEFVADTTIKGTSLLKHYLPIQTVDYHDFTSANKRFLIYEEDRDPGRDWFVFRLTREGWSVQALEFDPYRILYLVSR
jgi:hypothetical protein